MILENGELIGDGLNSEDQAQLDGAVQKVTPSTDNAIVRFDGTTGEVQDSGVTIDDDGSLKTNGNITIGYGDAFKVNSNYIIKTEWVNGKDLTRISAFTNIASNSELVLEAGDVERIRIDSNGKIGIGLPAPTNRLHISDNNEYPVMIDSNGNNIDYVGLKMTSKGDKTQWGGLKYAYKDALSGGDGGAFILAGSEDLGTGLIIEKGNLSVSKYTKLGLGAPAVKMKKLTGTTPSDDSGSVSIDHNLDGSKILSVSVLVEHNDNQGMPPEHTQHSGFQYSIYHTSSAINIKLTSSNSNSVKDKPVKILIIYKD